MSYDMITVMHVVLIALVISDLFHKRDHSASTSNITIVSCIRYSGPKVGCGVCYKLAALKASFPVHI